MKKILFLFILFLCSRSLNAQTIYVRQALGSTKTDIYVKGVLTVDSSIRLPAHDTLFTPSRLFTMVIRTQDTIPYLWVGTRWVAWPTAGGNYVNSFNGRSKTVLPATGDYTAAQVTNAVDKTQTYANPTWITSLAFSKITGAPAQFNPLPGYGELISGVYPNNTFSFDSAVVHPVTGIAKINDSVLSFTINNRPPVLLTINGKGGAGGGGGTGTLTSFSFVSGNGLIGSVTTPTTTPALTLGTNLNGIIYANGTSFLSANIGAGLSFSSGTLVNTITNDNQLANGAGYITNIGGYIAPGSGTNITGAGTLFNPYIISVQPILGGGGGGISNDSLKHLFVDTSAAPRNGSVLAFDSVNHKWYLTPNGTGGGGSGSVTRLNFTNANGFTGVVSNATTTPTLVLTMQNGVDDGATKGIAAYTAADFNVTSGVVALDYVNGQKATASQPGFLTAADWTTFNNKIGGTLTSGMIYVGNVSNVPTAVAMSGDVLISNSGVTTIQTAVVTYAKIQNVTTQKLLGRYAGTNGVAQEITIGSGVLLNSGTGAISTDTTLLATKYFVTHLTDTIGVGHLGGGQQGIFASSDFDSLYDKTHVGGYGVFVTTRSDSALIYTADTTVLVSKTYFAARFPQGIDDVLGVGQALTVDRSIQTGTHSFFVNSSRTGGLNFTMMVTNSDPLLSGSVFQATSAGNGYGVYGATNGGEGVYGQSTTGTGVHGYSGSGTGVVGESPTGTAGYFSKYDTVGLSPSVVAFSSAGPALQAEVYAISTNTVLPVLLVTRAANKTVANNIGGSIDFMTQTISNGVLLSNQIISKWTDASARTSQFLITGVTSGTTGTWLTMDATQALFGEQLTVNRTGISVSTYNDGLVMENKTPVNAGNLYEHSPGLHLMAHAFATSADRVGEWRNYAKAEVQGGNYKSDLVWESQNSGGGWIERMRMGSNTGILTIPSTGAVGIGTAIMTQGGFSGGSLAATTNFSLGYTETSTTGSISTPTTVVTANTVTETLPTIANGGSIYTITNIGTGTVTVGSGGAYNITNGLTSATTWTLTQGKFVTVTSSIASGSKYVVLAYN